MLSATCMPQKNFPYQLLDEKDAVGSVHADHLPQHPIFIILLFLWFELLCNIIGQFHQTV